MLHDQVADVEKLLEFTAILEGISAVLVGDLEGGLMSFWLIMGLFFML